VPHKEEKVCKRGHSPFADEKKRIGLVYFFLGEIIQIVKESRKLGEETVNWKKTEFAV